MSWKDSAFWISQNKARLALCKPGTFREYAACKGIDPNLFHPERGQSEVPAKKICMTCPVRAQCLQYALDGNELFGVWGATSRRQRQKLLKTGVPPVVKGADQIQLRLPFPQTG